jgi:hypothetical protein
MGNAYQREGMRRTVSLTTGRLTKKDGQKSPFRYPRTLSETGHSSNIRWRSRNGGQGDIPAGRRRDWERPGTPTPAIRGSA